VVGDAVTDYNAATENRVPFILRRTPLNMKLQDELDCKVIDDFL